MTCSINQWAKKKTAYPKNLLITSSLATLAGYLLQDDLDGPISFFITRLAAIVLTSAIVFSWWTATSRPKKPSGYEFFKEEQDSKSCCCSFTFQRKPKKG